MKKLKKLSIMLLCCLLLSVIAMPVSASAAKLNKKKLTLNVGKTYTLKASGTKGTITWTSSKKSVATITSKGVVKAKKKGSTVITAKYGKKKLTCKVTVKQPVTSVKLNKTSATLNKGKSLTLKATVSPSNANNKAVTWSTSNKKVATVTSKGVVKAVGSGTATITVRAKDGSGKKATCKITVKTTSSTSTDNSTVITTAEQLYNVLENGKSGVTYTLGKDIDLSGYSKSASWFTGTLDGNGHKLLNLKQRLVDLNSGTIKNIVFESCNLTGKNTTLSVITSINAGGTISNCTVKGKITFSEGGGAAAIAIMNEGTIINCNNYATITGDGKYYDALGNELSRSAEIAGICCDNNATITKCVNYGCLKGSSAAGIAHYSYKTVENCLNVGEVSGGCGLVEHISNGIVKNCVNVGKSSYGIAKSVSGNVVDCYYLTSASETGAPESQYVRMIAVDSSNLTKTSAYPTLDFSTNWKMGTKYPIPRQ